MLNLVTSSTHVSGHTLDLILSSSDDIVENVEVHESDRRLTDHFLITCALMMERPPQKSKTIYFRNYITSELGMK